MARRIGSWMRPANGVNALVIAQMCADLAQRSDMNNVALHGACEQERKDVMKKTTGLALTAALTLCTALPTMAHDMTNLSDDNRNAFRDEVRAYLMDNPEVLMEAIGVLEERQAAAQGALDKDLVRVNADALFSDGFSHVSGNPDGDITIVEFVDYQCGYCRKSYDVVQELLEKDPNIRLILKEYPILTEASVLSSRFAIAGQQLFGEEAYEKLHEALITVRGNISAQSLIKLADGLDLDGAAIAARMDALEVEAVLAENRALGQRLQITGTPAFVMHDDMARGYMPLEQMEAIIAAKRNEG
ncbi:DsbA family protein [Aliiroseovarius sp. CAU 1755]